MKDGKVSSKTMKIYTTLLSEAVDGGIFESGNQLVYHYLASVMMLEVMVEGLHNMGCPAADIDEAATLAANYARTLISHSKGLCSVDGEEV